MMPFGGIFGFVMETHVLTLAYHLEYVFSHRANVVNVASHFHPPNATQCSTFSSPCQVLAQSSRGVEGLPPLTPESLEDDVLLREKKQTSYDPLNIYCEGSTGCTEIIRDQNKLRVIDPSF